MKSIQGVMGLVLMSILMSTHTIVAQQLPATDLSDSTFKPLVGKHYISLKNPSTEKLTTTTKISFYFWPASASCYQLELALQKWQLEHPSIVIERIPLVKRPSWRLLAKTWLVAKQLNIAEDFLSQLYLAIHSQGSTIENKLQLEVFLNDQNIDSLEFITLLNSPLINQQLKDIEINNQLLPLQGVPSIIINEQWLSDASMITTSAGFLQLIDYLISNTSTGQ
ncbi:MAG: hypothetical protein COA74_07310 [Gammaproteobacteria bacterium]|nr:MAG: hypothetical protein COA74_07310 [Gammaproteobacteria bacterium]